VLRNQAAVSEFAMKLTRMSHQKASKELLRNSNTIKKANGFGGELKFQ